MRALLQCTAVALLLLELGGCAAKKTAKAKPAPQSQAPAAASTTTGRGTLTPPTIGQQQEAKDIPPLPATTLPQVEPAKPTPPPAEQPKHKTTRRKTTPKQTQETPKPAADTTAPAPAASTASNQTAPATPPAPASAPPTPKAVQQAEAPEPTSSTPIGQLTTGDSASGAQTKRDTMDLINSTEQGLNGIKRPLSREEQTTATKIKTFLNQAKQALKNGDVDGAHTLAVKAKLLLDELTTP